MDETSASSVERSGAPYEVFGARHEDATEAARTVLEAANEDDGMDGF
tara:strand:- start:153 stop:293 length:141 start_codon:yes stop_codon:yes gene_type:complete